MQTPAPAYRSDSVTKTGQCNRSRPVRVVDVNADDARHAFNAIRDVPLPVTTDCPPCAAARQRRSIVRSVADAATLAEALPAEYADAILGRSDAALYRSKQRGRDTFEIYDDVLHKETIEMLRVETGLRTALDRREIELAYQRIIDITDRATVAYEALARLRPSGSETRPAREFIGVAERTGLIVPIGYRVFRLACDQDRAWREDGRFVGSISVNLSPTQLLRPNIVDEIAHILDETQALPENICLEITESQLLADEAVFERAVGLGSLGLRLAIDDFGSGYSSLAELKRLPVESLKIDLQFVTNITESRQDRAIVESIIGLGHAFGLSVIGEGVETEGQLDALASLGCDYVQGYYIERPAAADQVELAGYTV